MPYKDKEMQREAINRISSTVTVRFVKSTDGDILEWLDRQEHKSSAIKEVLREYVGKGE